MFLLGGWQDFEIGPLCLIMGDMSKSVFVAMSGGVDSSVSAYILQKAGYEVQGIHLELSHNRDTKIETEHADLEHTCRLLKIPLHYLHLEGLFQKLVIDYFCQEYCLGRTPNPCICCNKSVKFGLLLDKVLEMGGDFLATGHYAAINSDQTGYSLFKGADRSKDQSYFLYIVEQKQLKHILFPLSNTRKSQIKQLASELGFPSASLKESQDICFIPDNDSQGFLADHLKLVPGEIVDMEGKVLGEHKGLGFYTIGQRQGMGISARERLYVVQLEIGTNRLIVGPESQLYKYKLTAKELNWISGMPSPDQVEIKAKVRYRSPEAKAFLKIIGNGRVEVCFEEPQRAIAAGQSVVFYQEDRVLGGGIIEQTL
jgi:tRNA-uridine 2-sulfurtransferase